MGRYDDVNRVWDDRAFKSYSRFTDRPVWHLVIAALALTAAIAAIVLAGWQVGWWFTAQNVNRESHLFRNSYANQQTLRDQITQNVGTVLSISTQIAEADQSIVPSLRAQRFAVLQIVCQDATEVAGDPLPADQGHFVRINCVDGNVSPASPYNQGVNP